MVNHLVYNAFGKVTSERSPAVDARSYLSVLSVTIPCLEESCDRSPLGLLFVFTARPMLGEREQRGNVPARPLDAETKQVEDLPQKVFGQQSTPKNLNRWYGASVGRWLSEDPVAFGGGVNLYAYSSKSPATVLDPSGEAPAEWERVRYYSLGVGDLPPVKKGKWGAFSRGRLPLFV